MTRIVSGFAGSLTLAVPRSGTRPTSDRVREAVFSTLQAMDAVAGMRVLDLYAGSGALGLEAISRGADSAVLVERSGQAAAVCRANAAAVLGSAARSWRRPRVDVLQTTVRAYLGRPAPAEIDLAFLDPPYDTPEEELTQALTALAPRLADDAVVVVERGARSPEPAWPHSLAPLRSRSYGETIVWFAQPAAPFQPA